MPEIYEQINQLISNITGVHGKEYTIGKFTGLGWLNFHYVCSTYDGPYPRISLKQYEKTVNVYYALWEDGQGVVEGYKDVFGKSNVGKNCIRIRKLDEQKIAALEELTRIALTKGTETI
ncbi:hypothetical protein [Culicoidibacter larvae]|uniref:DUF1801 domain-containing protein n=1 Tax=Culicoidibacter larvae TaxID=2579976 RepID=A0A5R8Q9B1_9FIRM|nr:hypothetical protein [Culicoidibacter larvae]TLG72504.1 hypothetical protein FEZ08_08940 [Culicoidibacter larvae]